MIFVFKEEFVVKLHTPIQLAHPNPASFTIPTPTPTPTPTLPTLFIEYGEYVEITTSLTTRKLFKGPV